MRKVQLTKQQVGAVFEDAFTDVDVVTNLFKLIGIDIMSKEIKKVHPPLIKVNSKTNETIFCLFDKKAIGNPSPGFSPASKWLWFNRGWSSLANNPAEAKLKDFEVMIYGDAVERQGE